MFRTLRNYLTILLSGSFDPKFYLRENRDVRLADVDPLWHYAKFGLREGRKPSAHFDQTQLPIKLTGDIRPNQSVRYRKEKADHKKITLKDFKLGIVEVFRTAKFFLRLDGVVIYGGYPYPERERDGYYQRIRSLDTIFSDRWRIYIDNVSLPGRENWYDLPAEKTLVLRPGGGGEGFRKGKLYLLLSVLRCRVMYFHSILSIPKIDYLWKLPGITRILDFHGVVPEEFDLQGDRASSIAYNTIERFAVMSAKHIVVVSDAMRRHIESKYQEALRDQFVTLPIFQEIKVIDTQKAYPNDKPVIVYAGGLQTWQQVPKMINAMNITMDYAHYVFLCPQPLEFQKMLPENLVNNPNLEIDSKPFSEILDVYFRCHYGFILREDIIVNNVACPTKLMEYLAMGVVPIVDCEDIGDFKTLGMQYVKLPDLLMKNLPVELERKRMVENNYGVYRQLQEQYEIGSNTLKKLARRKHLFLTKKNQ